VDASDIDVYTFSSQKAGGLPGSVVVVGDAGFRAMGPEAASVEEARVRVHGFLAGGTHHVGAVGALAEALVFLDGLPALDADTAPGMPSVAAAIGLLRDRLLGRLREIEGVEILLEPEVPGENAGLVTFRVEGRTPADVGAALIERGVHVRPATKDVWDEYFHVPLVDRLLPRIDEWQGVLRASPWVTNTPEDVDRLAAALAEIVAGDA
jgi:selenocysteine lyase/cysteine desulfurase